MTGSRPVSHMWERVEAFGGGGEGRGGEGDVARPSDRLLTVGGAIIRGLPYSSSLRLQAKVDFSYVKELGFFCWYYQRELSRTTQFSLVL